MKLADVYATDFSLIFFPTIVTSFCSRCRQPPSRRRYSRERLRGIVIRFAVECQLHCISWCHGGIWKHWKLTHMNKNEPITVQRHVSNYPREAHKNFHWWSNGALNVRVPTLSARVIWLQEIVFQCRVFLYNFHFDANTKQTYNNRPVVKNECQLLLLSGNCIAYIYSM